MKTLRLYKENVYLTTSFAKITNVNQTNNSFGISLDRTVFFPEGGGQSSDLGELIFDNGIRFAVTHVFEADDDIIHVIEPLDHDKCQNEFVPEAGQTVSMVLDWSHRFDNMQRHCGEHLLTGIFDREYGGVNRGFHMGESYMTIDISMEKDPAYKELTWDMCLEAERLANELIWNDTPMVVMQFETRKEAEKYPMRKPLTIDNDIQLVGIGSPENGWGQVMCCGTHPSTCGQVGMIKVFKLESNKGMYRVYFEAGKRAFLKYQNEMEIMHNLGKKLSAGAEDLLEKFEKNDARNRDVSDRFYHLRKEVIRREALSIGDGDVRTYDILTVDDLMDLAKQLMPKISTICFLYHRPSNTIVLVSSEKTQKGGKYDCGKLVKENASIYNGKGGGSPQSARAMFDKPEYAETFIDLITKHLR